MEKNALKTILREMGLARLEVEVYIQLLKMKRARVTKLAQKTGVTRTQLYPLLEKLLERGFVKREGSHPIIYTVTEPEKIALILEEWIKNQKKLIKEAEKIIKKMK